ncbi:hypothetical protein HGRIS_014953 [Hohenbuehelia grisea]|uniref:C2H2-type domain-containing protein n=1 Tax=Hohenbuehelia grisea TaxID=104357 RepID=A0ABR3J4U8_9AGAR
MQTMRSGRLVGISQPTEYKGTRVTAPTSFTPLPSRRKFKPKVFPIVSTPTMTARHNSRPTTPVRVLNHPTTIPVILADKFTLARTGHAKCRRCGRYLVADVRRHWQMHDSQDTAKNMALICRENMAVLSRCNMPLGSLSARIRRLMDSYIRSTGHI